ncbi:hypothetical protein Dsin_028032 [Dipteronia sinensis]|uniref:Uncharacterized protein n=1 Tax=Dipteronia sinensis TaxID=43782 RepID=A0AAE0DU54_9ROSI|nr:hypothetical protein Dsin_028032 [Dipteronia sinensis]
MVGNLPDMFRNKPTFRWIHKLMKEMNTDIACIRLGNVHVISVTCPEISREILRKHDVVFVSRQMSMSTEMTTRGYLTTAHCTLWRTMEENKENSHYRGGSPVKHQWFYEKRIEEADYLVHYVYNQIIFGGLVNVRVAA